MNYEFPLRINLLFLIIKQFSWTQPGWNDMDINQHVSNVKYIDWILEVGNIFCVIDCSKSATETRIIKNILQNYVNQS
jgi:hypothetical protein